MIKKFMVPFTPAKEERMIHMYLPDDYDSSEERYPVLYMFDGHNLYFDSDATFGKCMGMKEFMDGWWKKMIIVGMQCSDKDRQRVDEYCPFTLQSAIYGTIEGRGDETIKWIVNELKPFIDSSYRTWPQREATALAGYSAAGMLVVYAAIHYREAFSKVASISPSLIPAMDAIEKEIDAVDRFGDNRLFFSWGTNESTPEEDARVEECIRHIEAEVMKKGCKTYLYRHEGGTHNEASWQYEVPVWMSFMWE